MMAYVIACYVAGVLVFPFFWSFWSSSNWWPFMKARSGDTDVMFSFLVCVCWPGILAVSLVYVWWYVMSGFGVRARGLYDRVWKDFVRWARES